MSAVASLPPTRLIVLEANQVGGLGDISVGFKIASILVDGAFNSKY